MSHAISGRASRFHGIIVLKHGQDKECVGLSWVGSWRTDWLTYCLVLMQPRSTTVHHGAYETRSILRKEPSQHFRPPAASLQLFFFLQSPGRSSVQAGPQVGEHLELPGQQVANLMVLVP